MILFYLFRIIIMVAICIGIYFLFKKSHIKPKKVSLIVALILIVVVTMVSMFIPIENTFITFSTPESAFHYTNFGEVKLTVEGEQSDFVVADYNDTDILLIIPKTDTGWKLGLGIDTKKVTQKIESGITLYVYRYKDTDDYYIMILDTNGGESQISDSNNSKFYSLTKENSALNKNFYTYYAYIGDFSSGYTVTVNGNSMVFEK